MHNKSTMAKREEKSERQIRWEAFLEKAREVNPERHDLQAANGEFDVIPDSWVG